MISLHKLAAGSMIHGFGYVTQVTGTLNVSSFSFGSGATNTFDTVAGIPPSIDAASITLVQFQGVGNSDVNNNWMLLPGQTYFRNASPTYDVEAIVTRQADGQHLTVQFYNATFSSVQTVPNLSVNFKSLFFAAPW